MCRFPYTLTVGVDFWGLMCYNERQDHYKHEHLTNTLFKDSILILHELYTHSIYIYLAIFNGLIIRRTKHLNKVDLSLGQGHTHQIQSRSKDYY